MELDALRADLVKALPPSHPFLEKFDKFIGLVPKESQELESLTETEEESQLQRILDALDDWKRGIYDWEEVEREIRDIRENVS